MLSNSRIAAVIRSMLLGLSFVLVGSSVTSQLLDDRTSSKTPSTYQATDDWARYTVGDRDFSVLLPTTPAMSTYRVRKEPWSRILHVIGAYSEGVVYSIQILERKLSLEAFIDEVTQSSTNKFKRDVKVGDVSGKEYAFQDDTRKAITQYFSTKRYIFVFTALGSPLGNPDVGMPRFFESISFEPTQTALAITDGPGEQPVEDAPKLNTDGQPRILTTKEVTTKAVVVQKPEPTYTADARQNQVTGTVVLRCVFSSSGAVTGIRAISGLPHGLTENAIGAARKIKFIPAVKDGHFVSMHIQLEYSFNLY